MKRPSHRGTLLCTWGLMKPYFTPVQRVRGHSQPFNSLENIYKLTIVRLMLVHALFATTFSSTDLNFKLISGLSTQLPLYLQRGICGENFTNHLESSHTPNYTISSNQPVTCNLCKRYFTTNSEHNLHIGHQHATNVQAKLINVTCHKFSISKSILESLNLPIQAENCLFVTSVVKHFQDHIT